MKYSKEEYVQNNGDIQHPAVREVLKFLNISGGLELNITTDLNKQSGVGSSSACIVGLLNLLYFYLGKKSVSPQQLAEEANYIERVVLAEKGGQQDPYPSAYGGLISITIDKGGKTCVRPIPVCHEFISHFEDNLLMVGIGGSRQSFEVAATYDEAKADQYKKEIALLSEQMYSSLCSENLIEVGQILDESWQAKRQISDKISCKEIDDIYYKAMQSGGIGGKLLGSGGTGGFLLLISFPGKMAQLKKVMGNQKFFQPKVEFQGSKVYSL